MLEQELKKIIETSNNNITITDEKGIILYSNPKLWEIYGMEPASYIGTSVYQLEKEGLLTPSINALVLKEKKRCVLCSIHKQGMLSCQQAIPFLIKKVFSLG